MEKYNIKVRENVLFFQQLSTKNDSTRNHLHMQGSRMSSKVVKITQVPNKTLSRNSVFNAHFNCRRFNVPFISTSLIKFIHI